MDELAPPRKSVELEDPGAHELETSESEDHFSDASEGRKLENERSKATSPIPITRVERVDEEPAYGEVPGTDAYNMRTKDAVPDEIEVLPEGQRSRSLSRVRQDDQPASPGGTPIPKTVIEKVEPEEPSYGDVPGTQAHDLRLADAEPDEVRKAPEIARETLEGLPTRPVNRYQSSSQQALGQSVDDLTFGDEPSWGSPEPAAGDDAGFGDDFDDFEEGGHDDADFGDFDDGFNDVEVGDAQSGSTFETRQSVQTQPPTVSPVPLLDLSELESVPAIAAASRSYIQDLFPASNIDENVPKLQRDPQGIFSSERSLSLWSQLVSPPPMQPINWTRSRIRRWFLVSLGVPVDLDEILPASKQKKLILPSIDIRGDRSPRPSSDERANGAVSRLKGKDGSSTSVDTNSSRAERRRRGVDPPPELDTSLTTILCSTTDAALHNLTADELKGHVQRLQDLTFRANEVLEYWLKRKDSAVGDKEAFEGVIENLVKHARKVRK